MRSSASPQITRRIARSRQPRSEPLWLRVTVAGALRLSGSHELASSRVSRTAGGSELVEPAGIEPATFWLQTRRSPS